MSDTKDPYAPIAHLYEAEHGGWDDDLELYGILARRTGGPVLELGCGTGRVIIPLAGAGFEVHGIDLSDALLAIAHGKARDQGAAVTLERGDMRRLVVKRPYGLVLCALDTFLHLGNTDDHVDTAEAAFNALRPGGILAIDVFHPTLDRLAALDGVLRVQSTFKGSGKSTVTHLVSWDIDPATQVIDTLHYYDSAGADGSLQRHSSALRLRYVHRYEMELVLRAAGFRQIELYGSARLEPFHADSARMVFVATKPG